ncbi:MAG: NAD(P)H-dependent oxidoreductase [Lachnospiraceae bacterium]|nr:NAD(P)H-dependent oxidoreductase [Lachnospiraceae bacterium]
MKVLMLNGSPRKDGSTTAALQETEAQARTNYIR